MAGAWQRQLRAALTQALHMDDLVFEASGLSFDTEEISAEDRQGYRLFELEFNSTRSRRLRVLHTLPTDPSESAPAVVCIQGHGGTRASVYERDSIYGGFAAKLAASGYATIAADVGQHEVYEDGRTLMGERLWDVMRCVDYLADTDAVDPTSMGCAGLSLGGEMAMWLGGMDERLAATCSSGFLTTMDQMEQNHCMCWKFEGLRNLADYADIYALTAPRALMCQNGLQEGETQFYVPIARQALTEIEPIYRDLGYPERLSLDVHDGGHEIHLPKLRDFFRKHLEVA